MICACYRKWSDFLLALGILMTLRVPQITIFDYAGFGDLELALWQQNLLYAAGIFLILLVLASVKRSGPADGCIRAAFVICCILGSYYLLTAFVHVFWEVPGLRVTELYNFVVYELFSQDRNKPAYLSSVRSIIEGSSLCMAALKLAVYQCLAVSCYRWMKKKENGGPAASRLSVWESCGHVHFWRTGYTPSSPRILKTCCQALLADTGINRGIQVWVYFGSVPISSFSYA